MGGPGSGEWYRWNTRTKIEEVKRIDIRLLRKWGVRPGDIRRLTWNRGGRPTGEVRVQVHEHCLILDYQWRQASSPWDGVVQRVDLTFTQPNLGGRRAWLQCPGCRRRVGVLCGAGRLFKCRQCYGLKYRSQSEDRYGRAILRRDKLKLRTFDATGWRKPKGVHETTYKQLKARYFSACREADQLLLAKMEAWGGIKR